MSRPLATLVVLGLLVSTGLGSTQKVTTQAPAATNRLSVAILSFSDQTGDPDLSYGRLAARGLLEHALREAHAIHLSPGEEYARHQIKAEESLDAAKARKLGELIEARRVIWGTYQLKGKEWLITAHVLNVATGKEAKPVTARSADWHRIQTILTTGVLERLGVTLTPDERGRMVKSWTDSVEALKAVCKAAEDLEERQKPLTELEKLLKQAIQADSKFTYAHILLATVIFDEGRLEDAEHSAKLAVQLDPESASAHYVLGAVLGGEQKLTEAEKSLLAAARLDPTDGYIFERLGELYDEEAQGFKATQAYEHAKEVDPFSASIRAHLGYRYAQEGRVEEARRELREAERLDPSPDPNTQQFLAFAYERLRDTQAAQLHYEKLVSAAKKLRMSAQYASWFEQHALELKARLSPVFVETQKPKHYSQKDLNDFLRQELTQAEFLLVTNPIETTPDMERWARKLTADATNDLQKAQLLFEAVAHHVDPHLGGIRTAKQVFAAWHDTNASFRCSEYAALYVALSRSSGLDSYCVDVEEDCHGNKVCHECACVFLGDRALLVDPSYNWFGPPHRKFITLNDVEAIALWLSEQRNKRQQDLACELAPNLAEVRFIHVFFLLECGEIDEAKRELAEARKLEPDGPMVLAAEGQLGFRRGDMKTAIELLSKSAAMMPLAGTYLSLGYAYSQEGQLAESREAFRDALRTFDIEEAGANYAHRYISEINEALGDSPGDETPPKTAADFAKHGNLFMWRHEFDKAIGDYTEAVRLEPDNPANYFHRAWAYYDTKQFTQAIADLRQTLKLAPTNTDAMVFLAQLLGGCPEQSLRNGKEAVEIARKACELTEWKQWRAITALAGAVNQDGDSAAAARYMAQAGEMEDVDEESRSSIKAWVSDYYAQERSKTNGVTFRFELSAAKSGTATNSVDLDRIRRSAEAGDAESQSHLADYYFTGTHGCTTNMMESYKWASLAAAQGKKPAAHLIELLELFMTPSEIRKARTDAEAFTKTESAPKLRGSGN